jgi:hypothetical protein
MTQKLLDHFKRMQATASRYLEPEPYTNREGKTYEVYHGVNPVGDMDRDNAFIGDVLYMLDGPEQREAQAQAELVVSQGYPTEDAYMSAMRALHWRTEQLKQAGIEPLNLMTLNGGADCPHYPPEHFRFPITEAFPGDEHRQIYHGWRRYPKAMLTTLILGLVIGLPVGVLVTLNVRG